MVRRQKKKETEVEVTFITAWVKKWVHSRGDFGLVPHCVAVLDPDPWIGKYNEKYMRVERHRGKVNVKDRLYQEAVDNSSRGEIDWTLAGLRHTKGVEYPWDLQKTIRIRQELQFEIVKDENDE